MATLIPAIGLSAFDSTGERRLAERLEQKLDADYLLWHNVPIGPKQTHPDFVVLHARRGLLVLETKDWRLQTVQDATRQAWTILDNGRPKVVINPLAQARHCAIQVVNALERDPQLVQADACTCFTPSRYDATWRGAHTSWHQTSNKSRSLEITGSN